MGDPLRIMTYNVRYFGHRTRGLTSTEAALRGIASAIARLDPLPDVICLQEVETYSIRADLGRRRNGRKPQLVRLTDQLNALVSPRGLSYRSAYFASHRYAITRNSSLYTTGLGILVADSLAVELSESSPPVDITHRRLRATARWKQTRICAHLRVRHRASGQCMDIFNTHLSLPQFLNWGSVAFTRRMGYGDNQLLELENVMSFMRQARTCDHLVLMGDFNSLPGSPVYESVLGSGMLIDPLPGKFGLEVDDYRMFPSAGFMNLRMHLDYVFASPEFEWLDFADTHPFGHRQCVFNGLSDHAPIIGRARLSG